jgi:hypothetical protein
MNLFSSFIVNHIIKALEAAFLSHLPELQQQFLNEVAAVVKMITDWIESKLSNLGEQSNEKKGS